LSRDQDALLDIVERIDLIRAHGPADLDELRTDVTRQAATLHWLLIVGEAANRVSPDLRERHPEVPWRAIVDFRNLVAHAYDLVRLDEVWRVIEDDLPQLEAQVRAILEELE
jgi:uncharacterized protein with HEPN domain